MKVSRIVTGSYLENTYLVLSEDSSTAVVIDPGVLAMQKIRALLSEHTRVAAIFITHPHIDHLYGLHEVKQATGAPIYMHRDDLEVMANYKDSADVIAYHLPPPPPPPDRFWKDRDRLSFGDLAFEVIHTPGHTPGSVSIHCEAGVFTGDTLMNNAIGKTTQPEQFVQLLESIKTRLLTLPDETVIFPGHFQPSTIGAEKLHNPEIY